MASIPIYFLLVGLISSISNQNQIASAQVFPREKLMPIVEVASPKRLCNCAEIHVSSNGMAKNENSKALGLFKLSDSHFNAFKSTVYRNSKKLTLIGGLNQTWRIRRGSRAGSILLRNKSCKEVCPTSCSSDWEAYQRSGYVKDETISFECKSQSDTPEGSGDGKELES